MVKKSSIVALGLILLVAMALLADSKSSGLSPRREARIQALQAAGDWPVEGAKKEGPAPPSPAAIYPVTNTNDAGPGSLRDAINQANATLGWDQITFAIPGAGVHTIYPLSQLPALSDPSGVQIDGTTQTGATCGTNPPATCTLMIEINGSQAGGAHGLWITSNGNEILGLVIDSFEQDGICIEGGIHNEEASFNWIHCNLIGTDPTGTVDIGNGRNMLSLWAGVMIKQIPGGFAFENMIDQNLISGNYAEGVCVMGPQVPGDVYQNHINLNYIGTDITGTVDLGNDHEGVCLCEGTHDNDVNENLISGNDYDGVGIQGFNNVPFPPAPPIQTHHNIIWGNTIGLDINLNPLPNSMAGVAVGEYGAGQWGCADNNTIAHNTIAENGWDGVAVWEDAVNNFNADQNLITQNSIYDNDSLGIDLQNNGVTPNDPGDPDTGPNEEMNFPVINSAVYNSGTGTTTISGTVELSAVTVEVFQADPDPTGYGEGKMHLGNAVLDGMGGWSFSTSSLGVGNWVTATATDGQNNTSEFCANVQVTQLDWNCTDNPPPGKTAGGYETEPNDNCATADYAACETAYCGDIVPDIDVDWWVVNLPTDTCYCLHVRVLADDTPGQYAFGLGLNPNLTIYASDCVTQLFYNDDHNGTFPDAEGEDSQYDCQDPGNCYQPGTTLYIKIASSQSTSGPYLLIINCDTCECPHDIDTCDYYKQGYLDFCPNGMPDFDQKQDMWTSPFTGNWSWCGPVALANCIWWFDSKFEPNPVDPRPFWPGPGTPPLNDGYPLVQSYDPGGIWDDHDTNNVQPYIQALMPMCNTDGPGPGTILWDLELGFRNWIAAAGLAGKYSTYVILGPDFDELRDSILSCQDVILLLGFYELIDGGPDCQWVGGHYVTSAGVCTTDTCVCISDPMFDGNEGEPPAGGAHGPTVHNDASLVSGPHGTNHHDRYDLQLNIYTCPSPATWMFTNYPNNWADVFVFENLNPIDPMPPVTYFGGPIVVLLDAALIICPVPDTIPEPTPGKVKHCFDTSGYRPSMGSPVGTHWHELWPNYCEYWICDSWIDNGDGILSYCDTIDFVHVPTGRKIWEHVELVTPTIMVTFDDAPFDTIFLDGLDPNPLIDPITNPIGTWWHEVYPNYCTIWRITGWVDNGNGYLDYCDTVTIETPDGAEAYTGHVSEGVETDIVTTPLPTPGDEYDHNLDGYIPSMGDPTGTLWHELWPMYCQTWVLDEWLDNGDDVLSYCDYIKFRNMELPDSVIWKHVEEVTGTITATYGPDTFYFDYMCGNWDVDSITDPIGTYWHEVWPVFCQRWVCQGWDDNGNGYLDFCDYIELMLIDGPDSGLVMTYHVEDWETDIITIIIEIPVDTCEYYKQGYLDFCPNGMPDIDQKQDMWISPFTGNWSWCGPVALADCIWWFDSKFEPNPVDPRPFWPGPGTPPPNDGYALLPSFAPAGEWDDHDTNNVMPFIQQLMPMCNTDVVWPGTILWDLELGFQNWAAFMGVAGYTTYVVLGPEFVEIRDSILSSQDVILLLGFYELLMEPPYCQWVGGHYVTAAGVCTTTTDICISDPMFDANEGEPPAGGAHGSDVHNDVFYVSGPHGTIHHDKYNLQPNTTGCPSPATWMFTNYPNNWADVMVFENENPIDPPPEPVTYMGGPIVVLLDAALIICPSCCNHDGIRGDVDYNMAVNVADLAYLVSYLFDQPPGPAPPCFEEADVDASLAINVADLAYLVAYLFGTPSGPAPLPCP